MRPRMIKVPPKNVTILSSNGACTPPMHFLLHERATVHILINQAIMVQELVEVLGKSQGVVIMTPPRDSKAAQATLSTLVSALTQKHKVPAQPAALLTSPSWAAMHGAVPQAAVESSTLAQRALLSSLCCLPHNALERPEVANHAVLCPWQVLVAESYGGQDEPVDTLVGTCLNASADTSMQPLRIRDTPTESTYQVCFWGPI